MTERRSRHRAVASARLANQIARRGYALPASVRSAGPMVQWRVSGCRCRVLLVFLTADGWVLDGEDFKIPIPEWIELMDPDGTGLLDGVPLTLESYRAGRFAAFNPGAVHGVSAVLNLDVSTWPAGDTFEVGCQHGRGMRPLTDLAADCLRVRASGAPLPKPRPIDW